MVTTLIADGRPTAGIVRSAEHESDEVVGFAVAELRRYLRLITGVDLPDAETGDSTVAVHVGTRPALAPVLASLPAPAQGFDGYVVEVTADRVVVAGENSRGVLYGVYDVLERLGCRWYYPAIDASDPEIVPSLDTAGLEPGTSAHASPFQYRVCHPSSMIYALHVDDALAQVDWAAKARYNVMLFLLTSRAVYGSGATQAAGIPAQALEAAESQPEQHIIDVESFYAGTAEYESSGVAPACRARGMLLEGPNHCMVFLLPNTLFDEHPDWFGMLDGQRRPQGALGPEFCWSNADAVATFTDNCVAWLEANPHLDVFSCAPNDGGKACQCDHCAQSTPSDLYAELMNELRRKMDAAGLPVELEVLGGYAPVTDPPTTSELAKSVRVHWAHWGRHHEDWYGAPSYGLRDNIDRWIGSGNPLTMVNYYTDAFATPPLFPPVAAAMQRDNDWLVEQGFAGNASLMFPHESWWAHTLNGWLAISWYYADRPVMDLLDDYCSHYFGAAAAPMRAYHHLLATQMWLAYFSQGPRWSEPFFAPLDEARRAGPLLDQVELQLDEADRLATTPLDRYRLSRVLATGRALVLIGRARVASMPLVHEHARAVASASAVDPAARDELRRRIEAALEHERDVVEPAVVALRSLPGVMPEGFESQKLMGSADPMLAAISALAGAPVA
jgi:hypothetical protein